jgi:hypothetical protein
MRSHSMFIAALILSLGARAGAQPGPVFTAEDMLAIRGFAGGQPVAVSSGGRFIAYVLTDRDDEGTCRSRGRPDTSTCRRWPAAAPARRAR